MDIDKSKSPTIDERNSDYGDELPPKEQILCWLDRVESRVEQLRKDSMMLVEKRDSLFTALDAIRNSELLDKFTDTDRDDVNQYLERLASRCMTVEISVRTERDPTQEESLYQVNRLIDTLVAGYKFDPAGTRSKCLSYLAACSSAPQHSIDKGFENALLGCTVDDQKSIKKRLLGLSAYLETDCKIIPLPEA